jgi:hypothetical protein
MGWRTDEAYERKEAEYERAWLASMSPRERLWVRIRQAFRILLLVMFVIALIAALR